MKAQTRSHMNDQTNCSSAHASSNQCICISLALFAAFFVQSQNVCGESSPFDWNWVISIPVGLTHVNRYALNRYRLKVNDVIATASLSELFQYVYFYVKWLNKLFSNKCQQQLFGRNLPSNRRILHSYLGPLFTLVSNFPSSSIEKKYEFLLESSFNSSKLQEINNDIDKIPGIPMVVYLF